MKRKAKEAETRKSKEEKRALSRNVVAVKTVASLSQMFPTGILLRNMVDVKGGTFRLPDKVECTLSDFAIGKYQVTFEEYDRYCEAMKIDKPSDKGWGRGKRPVINVSWFDAVVYCNWLSEENGLARAYKIDKEEVSRIPNRKGFRLPTEAEWVFAYRGGIQSKGFTFSGSNNLDEVGWYWWNSGDRRLSGEWTPGKSEEYNCRTHYVGEKQPNELGLHDMSGNVYEWCWDWWATHPASKQKNPQGAESGHNRVIMGGSWDDDHSGIGMRGSVKPESRSSICGFRLAQDK